MASSLAAQLQVVAASQPREERLKGRASLLYEIKDAADIDLATIYAVGLQGERAQPLIPWTPGSQIPAI
jgi:U3 small nucleolar RNA-associated protein 10